MPSLRVGTLGARRERERERGNDMCPYVLMSPQGIVLSYCSI